MSVNDSISDMLTRVRNSSSSGASEVKMPHSKMREQVARILKQEGYVVDYATTKDGDFKQLCVYLKYGRNHEPIIHGLRRISKPGIRRYSAVTEIPRVLGGLGTAILSTSKGVVSDKEARRLKVGGEILCYVW